MSFTNVFCQDRAINILQRAIAADKMPHAYIFAGPEGVGKSTTATELARVLLCQNPTTTTQSGQHFVDSCGRCESCNLVEAGSHPDLSVVYKELLPFTKEGKSKKPGLEISVDVIREFLLDKVSRQPSLSQKTVFIIKEGHKLNNSSQNALLKVLEEPPAFCTIILLCSKLEKLLPTTQSRCQILQFGPIGENVIAAKLQQNNIPKNEALYWARFTQGSLGQALAWSKLRTETATAYGIKQEIVNKLAAHTLGDSVEFADWLAKQASVLAGAWEINEKDTSESDLKRRALRGVITMAITALNDAMKLNVEVSRGLVNADQETQIRAIARKFDAESAALKIAAVYKSLDWVDASVNEKLILEDLLLNLAN